MTDSSSSPTVNKRLLRVAIVTLGCKTNRADGDVLQRQMQGWAQIVSFTEEADLYIINSCTVTGAADRQSRQLIYQARRRATAAAKVVLTGCLAKIQNNEPIPTKIDGIDQVFTLAEHDKLLAYAKKLWTKIEEQPHHFQCAKSQLQSYRARPVLKVQDGCDCACSYCIVPKARGSSKSDPLELVEKNAQRLVFEEKFQEIVLTGIHLGLYGRELPKPQSLANLLRRLRPFVPRLRLSSIEPLEIDEPLLAQFDEEIHSGKTALCQHLHVPLQHGDDEILTAMNRPYRRAQIEALLEQLRRRFPDMALGTDLIAGFPGESEKHFANLLSLVENSPLTHLHVFSFSPRPQTIAATLPGRIAPPIIKERVNMLRRIGARKLAAFAKTQVDKIRPVLVEKYQRQKPDAQRLTGLTDNYLRVDFAGPPSLLNQIVKVKIIADHHENDEMVATLQGVIVQE